MTILKVRACSHIDLYPVMCTAYWFILCASPFLQPFAEHNYFWYCRCLCGSKCCSEELEWAILQLSVFLASTASMMGDWSRVFNFPSSPHYSASKLPAPARLWRSEGTAKGNLGKLHASVIELTCFYDCCWVVVEWRVFLKKNYPFLQRRGGTAD